jgi:hypothetical protein
MICVNPYLEMLPGKLPSLQIKEYSLISSSGIDFVVYLVLNLIFCSFMTILMIPFSNFDYLQFQIFLNIVFTEN